MWQVPSNVSVHTSTRLTFLLSLLSPSRKMPSNAWSVPVHHSLIMLSLEFVMSENPNYSAGWYSPCKPLCECSCLCAYSWAACPIYTDRTVRQVFRHWPRLGRVPLPSAVFIFRYLSPSELQGCCWHNESTEMVPRHWRFSDGCQRLEQTYCRKLWGGMFLENMSLFSRAEMVSEYVWSSLLWRLGTARCHLQGDVKNTVKTSKLICLHFRAAIFNLFVGVRPDIFSL